MAEYTKEQLAPYAPLVGDTVTYHKDCGCTVTGKVTAVDGNIAEVDYGDGRKPADTGFIWRFHDGLNNMHDWPAKDKSFECPRPVVS